LTNDVPVDRFAHFANADPAWAPDGKHVAFLSNRDSADDSELFLIGADGRGERRLTRRSFLSGPVRWAPDSRHVVFVEGPWRERKRIAVVDVTTGARRVVHVAPEPLDWSAGVALGWTGQPPSLQLAPAPTSVGPHRIRVVRDHAPIGHARVVGLHAVSRLAEGLTTEYVTAVSPDGSLAAFVRTGRSERFAVGVIALATGAKRIVARSSSATPSATAPVFSRDGDALSFRGRATLVTVTLRTGKVHLRAVDDTVFRSPAGVATLEARRDATLLRDRSGHVRLLAGGFLPQAGSWAPNGRRFALVRRAGYHRAQVVLFDGHGKRLGDLLGIREPYAEWFSVSWSTDGRWLLVTPGYGGSRPPLPPLYAYSVVSGRMSKVLRSATLPVAGPRGAVLYERDAGRAGATLWTGRIVERRLLRSAR
jgi:dipeptidyl aminopeptidase/acylaminoacyl peptidase